VPAWRLRARLDYVRMNDPQLLAHAILPIGAMLQEAMTGGGLAHIGGTL
jgi:hypothetical protein